MAATLVSYPDNGSFDALTMSAEQHIPKTPSLPTSWYTSEEIYELERRAIFSKTWLLITHKLRFLRAGDFVRYEIAGFMIVLCRDRDGNVNGFHNICRHRAYPVVEKPTGTARIFSCKYHGWSYGLNGKLTKAPGYQDLESFDKTQNNLLPIHVRTDSNGFIWINLDGKEEPEQVWEDRADQYDQRQKCNNLNFDDYHFSHSWETSGAHNWKTLADKLNAFYYNGAISPATDLLASPITHHLDVKIDSVTQITEIIEVQQTQGLTPTSILFPNTSLIVSPHCMIIQTVVPQGPVSSTMQCEIYRTKSLSEEELQSIVQKQKQVMGREKAICEHLQQDLNGTVAINNEVSSGAGRDLSFVQKLYHDTILSHREREQAARQEIHPARQILPEAADISQSDIDFCSGLSCETKPSGLAW